MPTEFAVWFSVICGAGGADTLRAVTGETPCDGITGTTGAGPAAAWTGAATVFWSIPSFWALSFIEMRTMTAPGTLGRNWDWPFRAG